LMLMLLFTFMGEFDKVSFPNRLDNGSGFFGVRRVLVTPLDLVFRAELIL